MKWFGNKNTSDADITVNKKCVECIIFITDHMAQDQKDTVEPVAALTWVTKS